MYVDTVKEYFLYRYKQGQIFVVVVKVISASLTTHKMLVEKLKENYVISFLIYVLHTDFFFLLLKVKNIKTITSTT